MYGPKIEIINDIEIWRRERSVKVVNVRESFIEDMKFEQVRRNSI